MSGGTYLKKSIFIASASFIGSWSAPQCFHTARQHILTMVTREGGGTSAQRKQVWAVGGVWLGRCGKLLCGAKNENRKWNM